MTRAFSSGIRTDHVAAGSSEGTREIPARGERAPARGDNSSRHSHPRQLSDEDVLRRGGSEHTHASQAARPRLNAIPAPPVIIGDGAVCIRRGGQQLPRVVVLDRDIRTFKKIFGQLTRWLREPRPGPSNATEQPAHRCWKR